jgi:alpha-beta hydrolase superfamily lysophospholipase
MRYLKMIAIPLLTLIVVFALWLRWNEPRMIYYPDRQIDQTPDQLGLHYDDVTLTTSDNLKINGWFLPCDHPAKLTVLLFHGNAGNISHRFDKLAVLRNLGVDTVIIDYRGYGRSEGKPDEPGTYRDARAAYDYLVTQRKVAPRSIVVYGESLGSAIAADLATKVDVGGLILEEAFTSIGDVGQKMFPFFPVRWLVRNKYDTLAKMPRIKVPLLIFHSRDDEIFNMRHAQRLFAAANDPKQLVELRGAHNDAFLVSAPIYHDAMQQFFASLKPQ